MKVVPMMGDAEYREVEVRSRGCALEVHLALENRSSRTWKPENFSVGWQFFDPETDFFILEGQWTPLPREIPPGEIHQAINRSAAPVRFLVTSQPPSHGDRIDS